MKRSSFWIFISTLALLIALFTGLVFKTIGVDLPSASNPFVFYANQRGDSLKHIFSRVMQSAQSSLFLYMYGLTDPEILDILFKQAERGTHVTLLYDPSASVNLKKRLPKNVELITAKGSGLMHQKILILDSRAVFLGSMNMTKQSLEMHDNLMIGIYHPGLAGALEQSEIPSPFMFSLDGREAEMWQLPDVLKQAQKRLIDVMSHAKKSVFVTMFTLTHPDLITALIEAHKRGIEVKVALDFYTSQGASKKALNLLASAGIPVYLSLGAQLLHHKWAYVDQEILVVGSANWTRSAFAKNRDSFLIIRLKPEEQKWMDRLQQVITWETRLYE